jgi:hypothetical protein
VPLLLALQAVVVVAAGRLHMLRHVLLLVQQYLVWGHSWVSTLAIMPQL